VAKTISLPRAKEAAKALRAAKTLADALAALSKGLWTRSHEGAACPADRMAGGAAWWAALPEAPEHVWTEARKRLAPGLPYGLPEFSLPEGGCVDLNLQAMRIRAGKAVVIDRMHPERSVGGEVVTVGPIRIRPLPGGKVGWLPDASCYERDLATVHALWRALGQGPGHPLLPLVTWWQVRPVEAQPYRLKVRASLPRLATIEADERLRTLPGLRYGEPARQPEQLPLPGVPDPTAAACPSAILRLYDACGGPLATQGRGAPWEVRLFVGAMLHLPVDDRDGEWRTLRFSLPEVESWLHPGGWDRSNRRRDWHRLPEALMFMRREMGLLAVDGLGWVEILRPTVIPTRPTDPLVEFSIRIPRRAAHGDRIDWPRLAKYGQASAAQYRAYLVAAEFMGRSARYGQPVTHRIAAPVLGPDGKPDDARVGRSFVIRAGWFRIIGRCGMCAN